MSAPCVVLSLATRKSRLRQFLLRWRRLGVGDIDVFTALEDRSPVVSCFQSHQAILASYTEPVFVFEDDAIFAPTFTLNIEPPEPVDMIWLGGQHLSPPTPVAPGWVRPTHINRSHAYYANDPQDVAARLAAVEPQHVDWALNGLDVSKLALDPFTVGQGSAMSDISGAYYPEHRFWND